MRWVILLLLSYQGYTWAQVVTGTGSDILPVENLDQATYPNSGSTDSRSGDMPGMDLAVPSPNTGQEQEERPTKPVFKTGPYDKDGNYKIEIQRD